MVYSKIDLEVHDLLTQTRKKLVELVIEDQRSISKTASKLGIKLSTAKIIIRKYKLTGEFFESRTDKAKRELRQNRISGAKEQELISQNTVL